jgi:GTP diphosphokinase / guanosine-3',5'-bis(diphosphate) 3'-diphosphatase
MALKTDSAILLRALEFAADRHRTQFRKGHDKTPYINHPIQVASLLANQGGEDDPELLVSAILHDVIEDTVDSVQEKNDLIEIIRKEFGENILAVTLEVTDDKTIDKKERKRLQVETAPFISLNAKKLKIADKIMNVRDITNNPPSDWSVERISDYFNWAEQVVVRLGEVNNKLEKIFEDTLRRGRLKYGIDRMNNMRFEA